MLSNRLHTKFLACLLMLAMPMFVGCRKADTSPIVARVYNYELHRSDLNGLVGEGVSAEDSLAIVSAYIDQWVRQTVVLAKAEKNVTDDFSKQLNDYRNNLLTYAYERQIVEQLLDTNVSNDEIAAYYEEHHDDFHLKNSIVKAVYVVGERNANVEKTMRRLLAKQPFGDAEVVDMEQLATRYGMNGYYDVNSWIPFYTLQSAVPITTYNENMFLKQNRSIVLSDDSLTYYVRIIDYKVSDEVAPLEVQQEAIKAIIINLRKVELLNKMQSDLLKEAEDGGHIEKI